MKIEITILGLLMEGNLYGYEIKKKIVERLEDYVISSLVNLLCY
jgi:DNA-binding PadR family transcriptional regulator